jgi:integrase
MAIKLDSKTARLRLPVRKKAYTARIAAGIRIAYRRNVGPGTWSVLGGGGLWLKKIGVADDLETADGHHVLDYWQAVERARSLARAKDGEGDKPLTIGEALDRYATDLKARGADKGNVTRVFANLPPALASKTIALLTARELRRWRDGLLAKGLAPATVGRVIRMAKAAFNLAAAQDARITNRDAWRTGLAGLPDAEQSRNIVIDDGTIRIIIVTAEHEGPEFALLVEVAAVTGARVSQLARLEVGDVQANRADPRLMMPSSAKGRGRKAITRRPVPIPAQLALRLRQLGIGRSADAPLLLKANGERWRHSNHHRLFQRTVTRVGLDPGSVTFYSLRHSSITRALLGGVPARVVAAMHDTSVAMLEKTYSRHITDHSDALARRALLDLSAPPASSVIPLVHGR